MKRIKTLVAVAFLLGCSVTVNAQLGGLVKNAKKAVKEKVEKKGKGHQERSGEYCGEQGDGDRRT